MITYLNSIKKARGFVTAHALQKRWGHMLAGIAGLFLLSACVTSGPNSPLPGRPDQQPPIIGGPATPKAPDEAKPGDTQPDEAKPGDTKPTETKPDHKTPEDKRADTGLRPAFMGEGDIKRIALILPLSARSKALSREAASMLEAAEMSVFDLHDEHALLIPLDSKGTSAGAKAAAKQALEMGADVIVGPITAPSVKAAGRAARKNNIPVIGFSTDTSVAGNGVYLLSLPPEAEVDRITRFAAKAGATRFAYIGPDSVYGHRVLGAYQNAIRNVGGQLVGAESYAGKDISVMQEPAKRLAAMFPTPAQAAANPNYADPYHVVLMPEGGTALRSLAPLLTFYNENTRHVQLMGTGLWNREDAAREPALKGGIFAAPDLESKKKFAARYTALYGHKPSRLASQSYDGVKIAAAVSSEDSRLRTSKLMDPAGFNGVDGRIRFLPDGRPDRGLAIYRIKNGHFVIIDPAPKAIGSQT